MWRPKARPIYNVATPAIRFKTVLKKQTGDVQRLHLFVIQFIQQTDYFLEMASSLQDNPLVWSWKTYLIYIYTLNKKLMTGESLWLQIFFWHINKHNMVPQLFSFHLFLNFLCKRWKLEGVKWHTNIWVG